MEVEWRWNGDFTIPEWEWECIPIVRGRNGNGNAFRLSWVGMGMGMHSENSRNGHKSVCEQSELCLLKIELQKSTEIIFFASEAS